MSNVTLSIGGRSYTVACDAGQEAHVAALGRLIDGKVGGMGQQSEARTLLFAALLLADELHEARASAPAAAPASPEIADSLERVAAQLESLAQVLESRA